MGLGEVSVAPRDQHVVEEHRAVRRAAEAATKASLAHFHRGVRVEKKPDGCEWYASREAQQQHGIDTAKSALEKLNIPTRDDLAGLEKKIQGISARLAKLEGGNGKGVA